MDAASGTVSGGKITDNEGQLIKNLKRKDKSRVFYGCPLFKSEVRMTNKEKFKEIFGIEPDCGRCNPYPCEENDCKYWAECENQPGCPCDNWWDWEFKEPKAECEVKDGNEAL